LVLHETAVAHLDPEQLNQAARDAVQSLYAESESANTVRSYDAALRYWAAWFQLRYGKSITLPVAVPSIVQFVVDHIEHITEIGGEHANALPASVDDTLVQAGFKGHLGPLKLTTVRHRLAVLSKAQQLKRCDNTVSNQTVAELMRRVRRAYAKRGVFPQSKPAMTREPLEALLATCGDDLVSIRDRALLLFAWSSGGRRRSETAGAVFEELTRVDELTYTYRLRRSKTNQDGHETIHDVKPIVGRAAEAMSAWLRVSKIDEGKLFRRVRGKVVGEPLSPQSVRYILQRRAALAGLGDSGFSAHSLRSGFMTEAGRQQVPLGDAMAMTDHRTVAIAMRYYQAGSTTSSVAAYLFDAPRPKTTVGESQ
jgi:integrase